MIKTLNEEILQEALKKSSEADIDGWAVQVGLDTETFFGIILSFMEAAMLQKSKLAFVLDEEDVTWLLSTMSATFLMGWYARVLQKDE